ncbi:hypothetical protein [Pectobacterium carotovorum]|uniref:hypothetical protein n=1 Tax=Pectobacterium brasiliense TaxID=180957 RepID=UPI000B9692E2|nr:hypothetical protein [Pectobacterium carotovorum]OYN52437.1 hypothetical protein B7L52_21505 [Pectobacterium carotovorum]
MPSILINKINFEANIWVVRPGVKYRYTTNFIDNSFIAIGHLDEYALDDRLSNNIINYENLEHFIPEFNLIESRNVRTQIESFLIEMEIGDVVFTLDSRYVIPGVVKSIPFYSNDPISKEESFSIRRDVEWGEPILRSKIPVTIQRSFSAYQTVFSLKEHSEKIFHWLMAFFISEDEFFGSLRIEQTNALKHHTLKQLNELIDRIQVFSLLIAEKYDEAELLGDGDISITFADLQNAMSDYSEKGLLTLTVQQLTMSPGDVWLQFKSKSKISGAVFLYLILTTTSPGKTLEFSDSSYSQELSKVQQIVDENKDILNQDLDFTQVRRQLILRSADQNTEFVESAPTLSSGDDFPEDGAPKNIGG